MRPQEDLFVLDADACAKRVGGGDGRAAAGRPSKMDAKNHGCVVSGRQLVDVNVGVWQEQLLLAARRLDGGDRQHAPPHRV